MALVRRISGFLYRMKQPLLLLIKCLSIFLITGAICLELWQHQFLLSQSSRPTLPLAVFWVARFALVAHGVEAIIAAIYAARHHRAPWFHAIYTFFVGTVGLVELLTSNTEMPERNQS